MTHIVRQPSALLNRLTLLRCCSDVYTVYCSRTVLKLTCTLGLTRTPVLCTFYILLSTAYGALYIEHSVMYKYIM